MFVIHAKLARSLVHRVPLCALSVQQVAFLPLHLLHRVSRVRLARLLARMVRLSARRARLDPSLTRRVRPSVTRVRRATSTPYPTQQHVPPVPPVRTPTPHQHAIHAARAASQLRVHLLRVRLVQPTSSPTARVPPSAIHAPLVSNHLKARALVAPAQRAPSRMTPSARLAPLAPSPPLGPLNAHLVQRDRTPTHPVLPSVTRVARVAMCRPLARRHVRCVRLARSRTSHLGASYAQLATSPTPMDRLAARDAPLAPSETQLARHRVQHARLARALV